MRFINGIERDQDHVFFIIDRVALTGQQGGLVNLRMQLRTYIQGGATDLPPAITETDLQAVPNAEPGSAPNGGPQ
jgi:hypothetical protein